MLLQWESSPLSSSIFVIVAISDLCISHIGCEKLTFDTTFLPPWQNPNLDNLAPVADIEVATDYQSKTLIAILKDKSVKEKLCSLATRNLE